jgi:hypothetical protein
MFIKKTATALLVLVTAASAFAQSQESNVSGSSQNNTVASDSATQNQKEALRAEILKLLANYKQTELDIIKAQEEMEKARQACPNTCTKPQLRGLLDRVQTASLNSAAAAGIFGVSRMVIGIIGNELGTKTFGTFFQPIKSLSGNALYGGAIVYALSTQLEDFLNKRDVYSVKELVKLDYSLKSYREKLSQTQMNLAITSQSLEQIFKLEQAGVTKTVTQ